jgi:hypothetical protein
MNNQQKYNLSKQNKDEKFESNDNSKNELMNIPSVIIFIIIRKKKSMNHL